MAVMARCVRFLTDGPLSCDLELALDLDKRSENPSHNQFVVMMTVISQLCCVCVMCVMCVCVCVCVKIHNKCVS